MSAFASAFLRRPMRNSADFLGQRALETPNCFPVWWGWWLALSTQLLVETRASVHEFNSPTPESCPTIASQCRHASSQSFSIYMKLTLRSPSCASSIPPHRNSLFMIDYVAEICEGALEFPPIDRLCGFASVFERDTEVGAASTG